MLLIVWVAVVVLALVVLGGVAYGVFGALSRLGGEAAALEREVRPVLDQVQAAATAAEARREQHEARQNGTATPADLPTSARRAGSEDSPA